MTDRFVIGLVGAPFGLQGFVKVRSFSGEIDHLLTLTRVAVRQDNTEKILDIEASVPLPPYLAIKFAGIDSPETAKTLTGAELVTDREYASPLKPGEYYIEDLRGLAVAVDSGATTGKEGAAGGQSGEIVGYITDIVEGGGGDLIEIRLSTGEFKFVPFRSEFFAPIDLKAGRLILLERWVLE